jgi:hypothetical protein
MGRRKVQVLVKITPTYIYIYIFGLIPDKYPKAIQIPGPTLVWRPSPAQIIITIIFWIFFCPKKSKSSLS